MKSFNLLVILFIIRSLTFGQSAIKTITVIPPSPAASAIERYSDYPVSVFTGVPDITIPIYEVNSGGLVLPISISYHASGIKVDDNSYPVGLGWALNANGRISRTLKDKADETIASLTSAIAYSYNNSQNTLEILANTFDKEPDVYFYNLGLKDKPSGRFVFDLQNRSNPVQLTNPMFLPRNNIRFDYIDAVKGVIGMTDAEGVNYKFGGIVNESKALETATVPPMEYQSNNWTTSWLCSEILPASKDSSDKISFTYKSGINVTNTIYSASMEVIDSITPYQTEIFTPNSDLHQVTPPMYNMTSIGNEWIFVRNIDRFDFGYETKSTTYSTSLIKTIKFNGGTVNFIYKDNSNFLENITVKNDKDSIIRVADFFYSDYGNNSGSPARIKLDSLVFYSPGMTEKMKYKFDYEVAPVDAGMEYKDFWGYLSGYDYNPIMAKIPTWENVPALSINPDIGYLNSCFLCHHVIYNGVSFLKKNISIGNSSMEPSEFLTKAFILKKITFPTGGYNEFEFEINKYKDSIGVLTSAGGLRVRKIRSVAIDGKVITKSYRYGKNGDGAGIPVNVPTYDDFATTTLLNYTPAGYYEVPTFDSPQGPVYARKRTFFNEAIKDLTFIDGSSVWYTNVDEFLENDAVGDTLGKTSFQYELPLQNSYNYFFIPQIGTENIRNSHISRINGYNFPYLVSKKNYKIKDSHIEPIMAVYSKYYSDESSFITYTPIIKYLEYVNWDGLGVPQGPWMSVGETYLTDRTYRLYSDSTVTYTRLANSSLDSIVAWRFLSYGSRHSYPISIASGKSNGEVLKSIFKYPSDYVNITSSDSLSQGVKNLLLVNKVSEPVEEVSELWSGEVKLGTTTATISVYLPDKPYIDKVYLRECNKTASPFAASEVNNGKVVPDPSYKLRERFFYNQSGHIIGVEKAGGMRTSYRWGYNDQYPIAECKNAQLSEFYYEGFEETVTGTTGAAHTGDKYSTNTLVNWVRPNNRLYVISYWFRNNDEWRYSGEKMYTGSSFNLSGGDAYDDVRIYPANAEMTIFTYKTLVGLTSQIDPKGLTTYYEHDGFQRLWRVKDEHRKVIKEYQYHYRQ